MRLIWVVLAAVGLAAKGIGTAAPAPPMDAIEFIARDYVVVALGAHALDADLVGINDPKLSALATGKLSKPDALALARESRKLIARIDALPVPSDRLKAMRLRSLRARLVSLEAHAHVMTGAKMPIAEMVTKFYGFTPQFRPLTDYDAAIDQLDKAMPGPGTLAERIERMKAAALVPADRIEPVFRAALTECRRRTVARLALPAESIDLQFTDDPTTPASAEYVGNGKTIVRVSRVYPADVDRLLLSACHEVYPGHHAHFLSVDSELYKKRGWVEFGVEINDGPQFPVAEATAEYGVGLAFPIEERIAFARDVLYPIAGLKMQNVDHWRAYHAARHDILGATATIVRDLLAGTIDDETAYRLLVRYRLQNPSAARQMIKMISAFGSFVIASDFGWYTMDQMMRGKSDTERWRLLGQIEREPMLIDDVAALR